MMTKKKRVYIYVNGVLNFPGKSNNWTGRAVTWTQINSSHKAEKVEYYVGPISRIFGQKKRSRKLLKTISYYTSPAWEIVLVGHSNGANVIMNALKQMKYPRDQIKAIHLFSPAAPRNFEKNGLNKAGVPVFVYIGGKDKALKLSSGVGRFLGYGALGKDGAREATCPVRHFITDHFGHSSWWCDDQMTSTMKAIVHRP